MRNCLDEKKSSGKVSDGKMSAGKLSAGKKSDGKMSVGKCLLRKCTTGKMWNGKLSGPPKTAYDEITMVMNSSCVLKFSCVQNRHAFVVTITITINYYS